MYAKWHRIIPTLLEHMESPTEAGRINTDWYLYQGSNFVRFYGQLICHILTLLAPLKGSQQIMLKIDSRWASIRQMRPIPALA